MSEVGLQHLRLIEAILFSVSELMTEQKLAERLPEDVELVPALHELKALYADRGINLVKAGDAWGFRTAPDLAPMLRKDLKVERKLSQAALETLAIVAYHQPVTRAEIEEVRGVQLSKGTLDVLFDQGWVRPKGRRRTPGRPMTWGTTGSFLDHFGLESLSDLPGIEELKAAGLLDTRPAIQIYGARGDLADEDDDDDDDDDEAEDTMNSARPLGYHEE